MLKSKSISLGLALALGLAACGSDESDELSPITGMQAAATINTLTEPEAVQFCDALTTYVSDEIVPPASEMLCSMMGLFFGDSETCEIVHAECTEDDLWQIADAGPLCTFESLTSCSASVKEVETCVTDSAAATQMAAEFLTCSAELSDFENYVSEPITSCDSLPLGCPGAPLPPDESEDPEATSDCIEAWISDGMCDEVNNNADCSFDGGDCDDFYGTDCTESWIGDGICDEVNNNAECSWDGGDCDDTDWTDGGWEEVDEFEPEDGCIEDFAGDSVCDSENNHAGCGWDGGDCCPSTCVDSMYLCGDSGFACEDPSACENSSNGCF